VSGYYDRDGDPLSRDEYMGALENPWHNKRVGVTKVNAEVTVSTVWLGLDHSWGDSEHKIFETMIFGGVHDSWCDRYSSEESAMRGHLRVVDALRAGRDLDE